MPSDDLEGDSEKTLAVVDWWVPMWVLVMVLGTVAILLKVIGLV